MDVVLSWIIATLITIPIIAYVLIFVATKQITKNHRKAVNFAMNSSTLLFIISVHFLIQTIWNISLLWMILLVMILISMTVVIVHRKYKEEIVFSKVLTGAWRLNALVFIFIYFCLVFYGIFKSVLNIF